MESTPVWGVDIRKETVAAFEAPSFLRDIAVGMTPHEHNGNGTPSNDAFITERNELPPKYLRYSTFGMNACITPASKKPNNR